MNRDDAIVDLADAAQVLALNPRSFVSLLDRTGFIDGGERRAARVDASVDHDAGGAAAGGARGRRRRVRAGVGADGCVAASGLDAAAHAF